MSAIAIIVARVAEAARAVSARRILVAAGTNLPLVSDVLRHATVGFTLETYVHPDDEAAATVAPNGCWDRPSIVGQFEESR